MKRLWLIAWTAVLGPIGLLLAVCLLIAAARGDLSFVDPEGD